MIELKPCPFCGVIPIVLKRDGATAIKCNNGAECWICPQTSFYSQKETAIEAWNDRTDVAPVVRGNTNADRIRGMTDEELAKFLLTYITCDKDEILCNPEEYKHSGKCNGKCIKNRLDWLRASAETEGTE